MSGGLHLFNDDDLERFEREGAAPLPASAEEAYLEHAGATLWYATCGKGAPVILLHGGLGHSGNWGYQVPALIESGFEVVLIDSRGHGRSTRDSRPYSYELMATDVLAVMDALELERAAFVGWSDGACTALVLADKAPGRVAGVVFFACNVDPSGAKEVDVSPVLGHCFKRHVKDYQALSATPDDFEAFSEALTLMQSTQPDYSAEALGTIDVPVSVVQGEDDEFIKREHAEYLAESLPNASFVLLPGVSHFAPLQRPELFNRTVLEFLAEVLA